MRAIMVAALIAPLAACSTVTRGATQSFTVETEPVGAAVQTSTGLTCMSTPCTFDDVARDSEFTVMISMPGYQPSTHQVTHQTAGGNGPMKFGNALYGSVVGVAFDSRKAATQDLSPNPLHVALQPEPPAPAEAMPAPEAAATDAPPPPTQ